MRAMFAAIFNIITTFFTSSEKTIIRVFNTTEHVAGTAEAYARWAEREAAAFDEITTIELEARRRDRMQELGVSEVPQELQHA